MSRASPFHVPVRRFLEGASRSEDFAIPDFVLVELYTLLRNPAVLERPLDADAAVSVIAAYRRHPRWGLPGFAAASVPIHWRLRALAAAPQFGRRRIHDARLALDLRAHGVTMFATANVRDFRGFGFRRVWNPLD